LDAYGDRDTEDPIRAFPVAGGIDGTTVIVAHTTIAQRMRRRG
jgi:hypothetical protein